MWNKHECGPQLAHGNNMNECKETEEEGMQKGVNLERNGLVNPKTKLIARTCQLYLPLLLPAVDKINNKPNPTPTILSHSLERGSF